MTEPMDFDVLKALWEEYRYRHELCWRVPLQTTAAAVILSSVPWAQSEIAQTLHWKILLVPGLGIALTIFALLTMWRELDLLVRVRARYRHLQVALLDLAQIEKTRGSTFRVRVMGYLGIVCVLQAINICFLYLYWLH